MLYYKRKTNMLNAYLRCLQRSKVDRILLPDWIWRYRVAKENLRSPTVITTILHEMKYHLCLTMEAIYSPSVVQG